MDNILITGGTGTLGREIVKQITGIGQINVISTRENPEFDEGINVVKADITNLESLYPAASNADIIIHAASNPTNAETADLDGTKNLLAAINKNKLKHFIYVSIAGVSNSQFPYYTIKYKAEQLVQRAGIPFTVIRATQFHDFVLYRMIKPFDTVQSLIIPSGLKFQSIDVAEVAVKIKQLAIGAPNDETITIGGPEILTIENMALCYLKLIGRTDELQTERMEGERFDMLRSGINLCDDHFYGKITWQQYLTNLIKQGKL